MRRALRVKMGNDSRPYFKSMPNFREIDCGSNEIKGGSLKKIYRSSRPDFLTKEEAHILCNDLGIRCVIDLRSPREYGKANGQKILDHYYPLYKVKYGTNDQIYSYKMKGTSNQEDNLVVGDASNGRKHLLFDFFKFNYVWAVYNRGPWYIKLYSLLFLIFDLLMRNNFVNFVRCYARNVLNKQGLCGQYIDMLTFSQRQIKAALRTLSEPENVPAMINCAHGKDRTGIVSALVLGCLGKSKEYIAYDYARSETELAPMKERVNQEIVERFHMCQSFTRAKAETMMELIEYIEETYGSIGNYLEYIGFGSKDQENLRNNLQA